MLVGLPTVAGYTWLHQEGSWLYPYCYKLVSYKGIGYV